MINISKKAFQKIQGLEPAKGKIYLSTEEYEALKNYVFKNVITEAYVYELDSYFKINLFIKKIIKIEQTNAREVSAFSGVKHLGKTAVAFVKISEYVDSAKLFKEKTFYESEY